MRLFLSLVLTTLVASAFAQDGPDAQIEAVNALPNVDVQLVDENTFTGLDAAEETAAVVDPSSVIISAINDAVETVAESLTLDTPVAEDEAIVLELEEVVEEESAPALEVTEESVVVDEVVEEDPAPIIEVVEDEVSGVENLPEEDEPIIETVATETAAPDPAAMEDDKPALDLENPIRTVADPEPEPEPTDPLGDAELAVEKPEVVSATPIEEEIVEVEEPSKPTKKELKAVEKFNAAVDNIVKILSQRLSENDTLPLEVDGDVLEELEMEVTTLPPTTTTTTTEAPLTTVEPAEPVCPAKWATKCLTTRCQGKKKCLEKCNAKGCALEKKNKRKENKTNKNKRKGDDKNKNKGDDKNKKNKKNIKNNKNKNNKNNRKNKNKTIRNKLFGNRAGSNRQSKDINFDDLDEVEQGRRKGDDTTTEKTNDTPKKGNRNNKNKNKNKNNDTPKKGNKNNKNNNKNKNKNRSEDLEAEAKDDYVPKSAEVGPLFATSDELFASSAVLTGFSNIRREGDVIVDLSGKHAKFTATVVISPLTVLLTNPASSLRRSEVTTELSAKMLFTIKEARRREKLSIKEVVVEVPEYESVSVLRSDLDLEPEVISAAQEGVSSAIDTNRVARIIHQTLAAAFNEDNILQNLEDHPFLMAKA